MVADVRDGWIDVECPDMAGLLASGVVRAWHHQALAPVVELDAPVSVHERHQAVRGAFGMISVLVTRGLGAPPDPVAFETWAGGAMAQVSVLR